MSHDTQHGAHQTPPPQRQFKNHPGNCYGMSQKRFWRIVYTVAGLTVAAVTIVVVLSGS